MDPDQLTSCEGFGDGDPCTVRAADDGVCDQGVCLTKRCGDGYRRDNEACDGDDVPADADCTKLGFYFTGRPTCNDACSFDTTPATTACTGYCGDGAMTPGIEVCETGIDLTATCVDQGFGTGALECVDCRPDTRGCIPFGWEFDDIPGTPVDVHGTAADDVWALLHDNAYKYSLVHYNGAAWTAVDLSACNLPSAADTLSFIFTPVKGVVFAAGNSTLIRVAGTVCDKYTFPVGLSPLGLFASGADDVWVAANDDVGFKYYVWEHDAAGWTQRLLASGPLRSIGGTGTSVYVTYFFGNGEALLQYTGSPTWTTVNAGVPNPRAIWGPSDSDRYVGSYTNAAVSHNDGTSTWTPLRMPPPSIGGSQPADGIRQGIKAPDGRVYIVGGHPSRAFVYDGVGWTSLDAPGGIDRMWATSSGKVFATNPIAGKMMRFAGSGRISTQSGAIGDGELIANASNDVYTIKQDPSGTHVYHWDGVSWTIESALASIIAYGVAVAPSGTAFVITPGNGIYKRNPDGSWSNSTNVNGLDMAAVADDDVWVLDTYQVVRWRSGTTKVIYPIDLANLFPNGSFWPEAIWASSPANIYVIGWNQDLTTLAYSMVVLHSNGVVANGWTMQNVPTSPGKLVNIYARSASDIYAIAEDGLVLHTTGDGVWTPFATPPNVKVIDLAGTPGDMFLATDRGLLHWLGSSLQEVSLGTKLNAWRVEVIGDAILAIDGPGGFHQILRLGPW